MLRQAFISGLLALALAGGTGCGGGSAGVRSAGSPHEATIVDSFGGDVPAGTTMWVKLDNDLSLRSRPGQVFTARVTAPVLGSDGEILIPARARVVGHVVQARGDHGHGRSPHIILRLDELEMHGQRQPIDATIVETDVKQDRTPEWEHAAIGAGIGAILGGLLEGGEGALVGGALGAVAGTAISLGTQDGELERGSKLAIRLERPIMSLASLEGRRRYY
jgi:hypothetical protein